MIKLVPIGRHLCRSIFSLAKLVRQPLRSDFAHAKMVCCLKIDCPQFCPPILSIREIKALLSSIPNNIHIKNREAYYHSLIYVALKISMMDVGAEIQTALK